MKDHTMYNSDVPSRAELPTTRQLLRSTALALASAAVILMTVVLPAEYAIDPTGIGRLLGLTPMGEIKVQLSEEAEADRARDAQNAPAAAPDRRSGLIGGVLAGLFVSTAHAQAPVPVQTGEMSVTLAPAEGVEVKMEMKGGAKAEYSWAATGGGVNYDLHASPAGGGDEKSYKRGRGEAGDQGTVTAFYDGSHGWFWRNRTSRPVTVTLKVSGDFTNLKRMK